MAICYACSVYSNEHGASGAAVLAARQLMRDDGEDADEETMYALLVASERVARWLESVTQQKPGYAANWVAPC